MTAADILAVTLLLVLPFLIALGIVQHRDISSLRQRVDRIVRERTEERREAEAWRGAVHRRIDDRLAKARPLSEPPRAPVPPLPLPDVAPPSEPPSRITTYAGVGPGQTQAYRGATMPVSHPTPLRPQ